MRFGSLALFTLVAVSGCAGTRWSVVDTHPLLAVRFAPAELHGTVDALLVEHGRAAMAEELRARGYQVLDAPSAGVPTLTMKIEGALVDDAQMHAPDDARHNMFNDLHYRFIDYKVHIDVVDAGGRILVCGSASAPRDPENAMNELTAHLVRDIPPATPRLAAR
ncbi:MAG TPA: hypothetical protein VN947_21135 [Polyangia bacterium]|nr:hypothetical protein [Polyangia bacterium]